MNSTTLTTIIFAVGQVNSELRHSVDSREKTIHAVTWSVQQANLLFLTTFFFPLFVRSSTPLSIASSLSSSVSWYDSVAVAPAISARMQLSCAHTAIVDQCCTVSITTIFEQRMGGRARERVTLIPNLVHCRCIITRPASVSSD